MSDDKETDPRLSDVLALRDTPPAHIVSLADSVVMAMSMYQMAAETVHAYASAVLSEMQARTDHKILELVGMQDKVILDPKEAWLMSLDDYAKFQSRCEEERIKRNLHVKEPGNCPALEAQRLLNESTKAFLDALAPVTHVSFDMAWMTGQSEKLRDWGLNLLSKHLNPHARFNIPEPSVSA